MHKKMGMLFWVVVLVLSGCSGGRYPASKILLEGEYRLESTDNMNFIFSKDSTLLVLQKGIYELAETAAGEPMLRICLDDISRELPEDYNFTEYLLRKEEDHMVLTYTSEGFNLDTNPMRLYPLEGEDGLRSGVLFDGAYQIGEDGDSYQYIFEESGAVTMQVREHYYADQRQMILSDHAGRNVYLYDRTEDMLVLKNKKEEPILTLHKIAE